MPYRDPREALKHKLRSLLEARRELDASIAETRRQLRRRPPWHLWAWLGAFALAVSPCILLALTAPTTCWICERDRAQTTARSIKSAAELHLARTGECPNVDMLVRSDLVDRDRVTDSWGHPFVIECDIHHITVRSPGADGVYGSDDVLAGGSRVCDELCEPSPR